MLFYPTTFEKPFTIWCPAVWKWGEDQRIRATMRFDTNWRPWNLPLADVDLYGILDEENPKNAWKMECQPLTIFAPEEPMASMEPQLSLQCKLCRSWRAVLYLSQPTFISKLSPGKLRPSCFAVQTFRATRIEYYFAKKIDFSRIRIIKLGSGKSKNLKLAQKWFKTLLEKLEIEKSWRIPDPEKIFCSTKYLIFQLKLKVEFVERNDEMTW